MTKLDIINNRIKNNCAKLLFNSFQSIIYTDWKNIVLRERCLQFKINTYILLRIRRRRFQTTVTSSIFWDFLIKVRKIFLKG